MSLRLRLLLIIGLSLSILWGAVAGWMFMDARQSLRNALDNRLAASARMVAGLVQQLPHSKEGIAADKGNSVLDVVARDGLACEVSLVRGEVTLEAVARTVGSPSFVRAEPGFSTNIYGNKRWRTYVLRMGDIQIATADRLDVREALMKELALSVGLPFIVALFGSMVLLWFCIGKGLAPLEFIRNLLERRRPGDDSPLPDVKMSAELRPLLRTIEGLLERVQAAIVRERRFSDSAAHELRTPLTGIKTHIQVARLALQRPDAGAVLDTALVSAEKGAQQLQGILERLLELTRLEGQPAEMELTDPKDAARAAIEEAGLLFSSSVRVSLQVSDTHLQACMPRPLLVSALRNLIDNALRYSFPDTAVIVRVVPHGSNALQFSVLDEGPGLEEQERVHALNRFWRRDPKQPGNGLGLSIVDVVARQHGGGFELLARNGPGLEARLTLPAVSNIDATSL